MHLSKMIISGFATVKAELNEMGNITADNITIVVPLGTDFWYQAPANMQIGDLFLEHIEIVNAPLVSDPIDCVPIWRFTNGSTITGLFFDDNNTSSPYKVFAGGVADRFHLICKTD